MFFVSGQFAVCAQCQHSCAQVKGHVMCSCAQGYILRGDARTCAGLKAPAVFLRLSVTVFLECCFVLQTSTSVRWRTEAVLTLVSTWKELSDVSVHSDCSWQTTTAPAEVNISRFSENYMKSPDVTRSCLADVDECASDVAGCEQVCVNLEGSFRCACQNGFALNKDGRTCYGIRSTIYRRSYPVLLCLHFQCSFLSFL